MTLSPAALEGCTLNRSSVGAPGRTASVSLVAAGSPGDDAVRV